MATSAELHEFLTRDHERLDALLARCLQSVDPEAYDAFRRGLLRHISIEERVLFPLLREGGASTAVEEQLHRDQAALAALLVPPPTHAEIVQIAAILEPHNELEERAGGMYERVEALCGPDLAALMTRVHAIPEVRVAPNAESAIVRSSIEQLVRDAEEGRRKLLG